MVRYLIHATLFENSKSNYLWAVKYQCLLQFWAAYAGCDVQFKDSVRTFTEQIDVIKRLVKKYPDDLEFVTTAAGQVTP